MLLANRRYRYLLAGIGVVLRRTVWTRLLASQVSEASSG
jgi:hypothetical protein